ncbi:MAG: hypothetical protein EA377_03825 [Phycisphaerales bacterium]|nr:MAG: hypothetical protein EA377_03825 [Phycisphaerales bacterium]
MPDPATIAWFVGALAIMIASGWIASYAGYFYVALYGFESMPECSLAYLNPVSRLLGYYGLPLVLTVIAAWMMPHWSLSVFVVLYVLYKHKSGSRLMVLDSVDRMTEHFMESEGLSREDAFVKADRLIATLLGRYSQVHARTQTTNYHFLNHIQRIKNKPLAPRSSHDSTAPQ